MREKLKAIYLCWRKPVAVALLVMFVSWTVGYWFTVGARAAGGLVVINVKYAE